MHIFVLVIALIGCFGSRTSLRNTDFQLQSSDNQFFSEIAHSASELQLFDVVDDLSIFSKVNHHSFNSAPFFCGLSKKFWAFVCCAAATVAFFFSITVVCCMIKMIEPESKKTNIEETLKQ
eukprot:GDKJ01048901.1.p1 GENE.GDKJ01048901.1~~GDKJ01048901.1.p1  ORF type:complete len:121 (+),score=18.10 GDKJ01048901.1:21-383(+)